MGAPNSYFVDTASGDDGNTGGIGDPWLTVQHALTNGVRATNGGLKINIKGDDTRGSAYTWDTGASASAPTWICGYGVTEDDGVRGGMDAGTANQSPGHYHFFHDMKLTSSGSTGWNHWIGEAINCEYVGKLNAQGSNLMILGCEISNTINPVRVTNNVLFLGNKVTYDTGTGIDCGGDFAPVLFNELFQNGTSGKGISLNNDHIFALFNSLYCSTAGTGMTALYSTTLARMGRTFIANLIHGYEHPIDTESINNPVTAFKNSHYWSGTESNTFDADKRFRPLAQENEALGSTPFTSSSDLTPLDVGAVLDGIGFGSGMLQNFRGAKAPATGGGGGGDSISKLIGIGGGLIG